MLWKEMLDQLDSGSKVPFSVGFIARWSGEEWNPSKDDKTAAVMLHTQINSRIATQRLGYLDGVEKAALQSVYGLFDATRKINDRFPDARHFDAIAWDVLNAQVRPFTAKWHRESERGVLSALDSTDEFRAELTDLQVVLRQFDNLLLKLYDDKIPSLPSDLRDDREERIEREMHSEVRFGISKDYGGLADATATAVNECELLSIQKRRSHYGVREGAPDAVGLALSGGGIRSATFSLGVLVALAQRNLMPQIDFLSTVSGGGYIGSFLTAFLSSRADEVVGLRATDLPFRRESGEAEALRYVRHHCKYLTSGSRWDRAAMIATQLYGMFLNGLAMCVFVAAAVSIEQLLQFVAPVGTLTAITLAAILGVLLCGAFSLLTLRVWKSQQKYSDYAIAGSMAALMVMLCIQVLQHAHVWYRDLLSVHFSVSTIAKWLGVIGSIPVLTSAIATVLGQLRKRVRGVLLIVTGIAAPAFVIGLYLMLYDFADVRSVAFPIVGKVTVRAVVWCAAVVGVVSYSVLFDANSTSPHRHYRNKLAEAFLIQLREKRNVMSEQKSDQKSKWSKLQLIKQKLQTLLRDPSSQTSAWLRSVVQRYSSSHDNKAEQSEFTAGVSIPISSLATSARCPYHLINCALNVPGSKNIALQGRLTDFFLFSPCFSGSSLTGFYSTPEWEKADPHLDLGTAMAISGAAAAPQMGLSTIRSLSFWLALLNIRLGYWAHRPNTRGAGPGLSYLWREMLGTMDEKSAWLNLSDGGHIENLGVYELLRRRCKYIIAVDGEQDPKMTFHALTTLQRLVSIDLGIQIDLDLDDLRLNNQNLSRSHFRFCRVRYPKDGRGSADEFGYLLYVKLSLTGNEGEFIRRYRLDNPAFPHDSTANQFFTEAQFEAYRSLGEHVGDKLFLRAIVGELADATAVSVEEWFLRLGKALLEPVADNRGPHH
jgi:hypothetical protein